MAACFPTPATRSALRFDPETGLVEILDYAIVEDCGKMVNPMIVEGQTYGGAAQGIGTALSKKAPTTITASRSHPRCLITFCRVRWSCRNSASRIARRCRLIPSSASRASARAVPLRRRLRSSTPLTTPLVAAECDLARCAGIADAYSHGDRRRQNRSRAAGKRQGPRMKPAVFDYKRARTLPEAAEFSDGRQGRC